MRRSLKKEAEKLAKVSQATVWAHVMICTYFDNRPVDKTQEKYKQQGLLGTQYLWRELQYILNAVWKKTPEFLELPYVEYLINKYPHDPDKIEVAKMDLDDRKALAIAFANQLGIHWTIFPFTEEQIFGTSK